MILQALYNSGLNRQVDKATVVFGHGMNVIGGNGWCARPKLSLCALIDGARGNQRRKTMDTASGSWLELRSMIDRGNEWYPSIFAHGSTTASVM